MDYNCYFDSEFELFEKGKKVKKKSKKKKFFKKVKKFFKKFRGKIVDKVLSTVSQIAIRYFDKKFEKAFA